MVARWDNAFISIIPLCVQKAKATQHCTFCSCLDPDFKAQGKFLYDISHVNQVFTMFAYHSVDRKRTVSLIAIYLCYIFVYANSGKDKTKRLLGQAVCE